MSRIYQIRHEFVECIPRSLQEGVVYVSIPYATAVHLCCCGCGSEVVTPLTPTDWALTFDGESISLSSSIGNWGFLCRSHYWIRRNRVRWARQMTTAKIVEGREFDRRRKADYYAREARQRSAESSKGVASRED